ncbi:hypothetical protein CEK00_09595 [Stenotrophomonas maltophilia]|uniref:Type III secretion protein n=1 Tax=Stenotrophomonas maltophilia TaxID=40324 RepID=A0A270MXZ6_STEMA|nr:hypothetical protein [Stenotrophomonas maltophilia]PAM64677.1 hypothetical protein CEK00_21915 [Stenotrophomonas maltophilia]PAM71834.1 hypothetical protein CEK00_09595 [Stenotrophomonas maltophilia]
MRPRDLQLWRIACDPVAYHHRWQHQHAGLTGDRRSAVNAALAAQHGLFAAEAEGDAGLHAWRLIEGWKHLQVAAQLLALAKQPRAASAHPGFLRLPDAMRQFMQLGFAPAPRPSLRPMGRDALQAWGAGYIIEGLAPRLPYWLAQRLCLPFVSLAEGTGGDPESFDHSCFWSALSHAQTVTVATWH